MVLISFLKDESILELGGEQDKRAERFPLWLVWHLQDMQRPILGNISHRHSPRQE